MLSADWVERSLIDDYPPTAGYALMPKGHKVLTALDGLY
jgi:DNA-binding HxlR family transcriptional regulator